MLFLDRLEISFLVQKLLYLILVSVILLSQVLYLLVVAGPGVFHISVEAGLHLSLL